MANYAVQYRIQFEDQRLMPWQIDLCLKDGPTLAEPIQILGSGTPLVIERQNTEENKLEGIIQTVVTVEYVIRPDSATDPLPETFILIEADDWLVNVYRNGLIHWKGFLNPGKKTYPFTAPPFTFNMTASDFSFSKSQNIDLNDPVLFLYDYISLGDFFNRALFTTVGYDDVVLNVVYSNKPAAIGVDEITGGAYIHTDAYFDFNVGAELAFDALHKTVKSMGARLFHEQGAYWLQLIEDIGRDDVNIIQITPDNLSGVILPNLGFTATMGNTATDQVIYTDLTAEVAIQQPLKSQQFDYPLKTINKIPNFDWRTETESPFTDWEGDNTGFYERVGAGGVEDLYRLRIHDFTAPGIRSIWSRVPVNVNQRVRVKMRAKSFLTLGSPSTTDFEVYLQAIVMLVKAGTLGGLERKFLSPSGSWESFGDLDADSYYHISSRPNSDDIGELEILSNPIPALPGVTDYEILYIILDTGINTPPPMGSDYYTELYPVFMGIYNNPFVKYEQTINTPAKYAYSPDNEEMFFIDTQDPAFSNNFYYFDSGNYLPLPFRNWTDGRTIDEIAVKQYADEQPVPYDSIMGNFYGNTLNFTQAIALRDKAFKMTMQVRDRYSVKQCSHELMVSEIFQPGAAVGLNYIVKPLTQDS